jgi:putative intracellular protease/amidase
MFKRLKLAFAAMALVFTPACAYGGEQEQADTTDAQPSKEKILIVVANETIAPTTGWPVGFWAAELTHPYFYFQDEGYDVVIASPEGGAVSVDGYSDPRHESQYAAYDFVSLGFLESAQHAALLENTVSISDVKAEDFAAIVVAGGQSPMFTFRGNEKLETLFMDFYASGKPAAALCHGVSILMDIKNEDGSYFIEGKNITGFSYAEDKYVDSAFGTELFEWYIEPLSRERGANYSEQGMWASYATADGNLITGQQQMSGLAVAEIVVDQLHN